MRIAFIGQKGLPAQNGGIERYVENLSANLAKRGHEVLVYSRYYYRAGIKEYKGVRIIAVPSLKSKNFEAITHTFFACLDVIFRKVDVINFQAIGPSSLIWLVKLFKPKTPVVFTFHCKDYEHQKWGGFARWYLKTGEKLACRFADKTLVTSHVLGEYVKEAYNFSPTYSPCGAYIEEKIPVRDIRRWGLEDGNYIAYIGRLVRHKGVHYLIKAFKEIQTDKKLVIVGDSAHTDDYVQEIKAMAKDDERIIFTGNQSGSLLKELFSNTYVFVQPSEYEGMSVALMEAMGHQLACLVSDIPQNLEGIGKAGLSFKDKDAGDLREKLAYLINNPDEAKRLGQAAGERIQKEYNWESITSDVEQIYKSLK